MPSLRIRLALGCTGLLVAVVACNLYFFRPRHAATAAMAPGPEMGPEVVRSAGSRIGERYGFVINPVYPPQLVGKYDKEAMKVIPVASPDAGQQIASPEPVFLVNPAYPPQVTGTVEPLGPGKQIMVPLPGPVPQPEPRRKEGMVRKDAEGGAVRLPPKSR